MKRSVKARLEAIQGASLKAGAFVGSLALTGVASAQTTGLDTAPIVAEIESQGANVVAIGAAVLTVLAIIAGITYLRRVTR